MTKSVASLNQGSSRALQASWGKCILTEMGFGGGGVAYVPGKKGSKEKGHNLFREGKTFGGEEGGVFVYKHVYITSLSKYCALLYVSLPPLGLH